MVWSRRLLFVLATLLICRQAAAATILIEFTSPTCGPCRAMRPAMQQLAKIGFDVREVDTSREPGLGIAKQYRVVDLPTFVVLVDGAERARLVGGGNSVAKMVEMIHTAESIARSKAATIAPAAAQSLQNPFSGPGAQQASLETPQPGRVVPIDHQPAVSRSAPRPQSPAPVSADTLISATVKICIDDPDGKSSGTGTIVDSREGKALVLTCGHLFRTSGGKGPIEIALFSAGPNGSELRTTVEGTLIDYDLERDLALVCFVPDEGVKVAPIAPATTRPAVDQPATSVGCEHGANPTAWATQITAVDRYQGAPNIEAAKAPVEGRSGGGLFNSAGQLIGVCNAADPQRDEGLYAALPSIYAKLDALKLAFVYQAPSLGPQADAKLAAGAELAAKNQPFEVRGQNPTAPPATFPAASSNGALAAAATTSTGAAEPADADPELSANERAALQEINRRGSASEVICIIRPREPGGRSDVIKLDRASPAFVRALGGGLQAAGATAAVSPTAEQPFAR